MTVNRGETLHASAPPKSAAVLPTAHISVLDGLPPRRGHDREDLDTHHLEKRARPNSALARTLDVDAAATTVVHGLRRRVAQQSFDRMLLAGSIWAEYQDALARGGLLKPDEPLTLARLSSINLSALRNRLKRLKAPEIAFLARFLEQEFVATHFTDSVLAQPSKSGGQLLAIFSRDKLIDRKIEFNEKNTTEGDLSQKGDCGYVFFALECTARPGKRSSRFGATGYRVPFKSSVFQDVAWGALDDLLGAVDKDAELYMAGLSALSVSERAGFSRVSERANRDFSDVEAGDDIFTGKDLLAGAGLALVEKLRTLRGIRGCALLADKLLDSRDPDSLSAVMNGILRPEIRVPRHFFSKQFQTFTARKAGAVETNATVAEPFAGQAEERPPGGSRVLRG